MVFVSFMKKYKIGILTLKKKINLLFMILLYLQNVLNNSNCNVICV